MKVAVVGSRSIAEIDIGAHMAGGEEIVSGGTAGVDSCAAEYAKRNGLTLTVFLPEYERYGRAAPIVRNKEIVDYADKVIVFRNGSSKGTLSVIQYAERVGKPCEVILCGQ